MNRPWKSARGGGCRGTVAPVCLIFVKTEARLLLGCFCLGHLPLAQVMLMSMSMCMATDRIGQNPARMTLQACGAVQGAIVTIPANPWPLHTNNNQESPQQCQTQFTLS